MKRERGGAKESKQRVSLFLDSGAFSAWSQGVTINMDEYIKFIKDNEDCIDVYACLDVIGDPAKTYENQKYMESKGLKPLITFHNREDYKWLKKYVEEYDYIALGGIAGGIRKEVIVQHLDICWGIICDDQGMPKVKVHGFGMTALDLMFRYPWYSVDSTSWVLTGRHGGVFVPIRRGGEYVYNETPWKVAVSSRSPAQEESGQHIETFSPEARKIIMEYIEEKGFKMGESEFRQEPRSYKLEKNERWVKDTDEDSPTREVEVRLEDGLSNSYKHRDQLNIIYFMDLEKKFPSYPWAFKKARKGFGLF